LKRYTLKSVCSLDLTFIYKRGNNLKLCNDHGVKKCDAVQSGATSTRLKGESTRTPSVFVANALVYTYE